MAETKTRQIAGPTSPCILERINLGGDKTLIGGFCEGEPEIEIAYSTYDVTYISGRADLEALSALIDRLLKSTPPHQPPSPENTPTKADSDPGAH